MELSWIPGHAGIPRNEIAEKTAKEVSRRQEAKIPCSYQDMFPFINDAIQGKWNTKWNEKYDKLKEIKPNTQPWKENNRCRKDETVNSRLTVCHTLLTHGHLMEGLPVPECELCHSHALTVKHLLTECANLASVRLRFFNGSNPNTLKQIRGRIK